MADFCRRATSWLRRFSTEAPSDLLSKWLQEWTAVPPPVLREGMEPPTALSWMRRRGPPLPEAALRKLFRLSTIRLYDPGSDSVRRISHCKPLPPGAMLLIPNSVVARASNTSSTGGSSSSSRSSVKAAAARQPQSAAQARAAEAWAALLCSSLLLRDPDFLAVNKPAGLACQGGSGVAHSVDSVMAAAFSGLPAVHASQLRLVHRLDRETTGALLLATGPDAAAWLAAAFRNGSEGEQPGGSLNSRRRLRGRLKEQPTSSSRNSSSGGASIRKMYWAVVVLPHHRAHLPASGSISLPVPGSKDPSGAAQQAALTRYRVLHTGQGLAWLELEPATGRKHQLRLHCAKGLGAPILGDARYGELRSGVQAAALAAVRQAESSASRQAPPGSNKEPPLFLHCRCLVVRKPGARRQQEEVRVTAPLPPVWHALLAQQGWPLPAADAPP